MRGKVFVGCQIFFLSRITPAYAGKRKFRRLFLDEFRDHPRLCGEKSFHTKNSLLLIRITPAYAGKSSGWRWVITISQDHPRLCGEKLLRENGSVYEIRITPAYAGKRDKTFGDECEK